VIITSHENNIAIFCNSDIAVPTTFGMIPGRITYLIDKKGIVRNIFSSQFHAKKHIDESLKILQNMNNN
jgi:peroxiredoxin Q/BCP